MRLGLPICSISWLYSRQQRTSNGPQEGTFDNNDAVPTGTRGNQSLSRTHRILPETHRWICENSNTFNRSTQERSQCRERMDPEMHGGRRNAQESYHEIPNLTPIWPTTSHIHMHRRKRLCNRWGSMATIRRRPTSRRLRQPKTYEARTKLLSTRAGMLGDCLHRQGFSPLLTWISIRNQGYEWPPITPVSQER